MRIFFVTLFRNTRILAMFSVTCKNRIWPVFARLQTARVPFHLIPPQAGAPLLRNSRKSWPSNRGWTGEFLRCLAPRPAALALLTLLPAASAGSGSEGYWTDPQTHLTWASADNGSGVTQSQAAYYCRSLTLGGHRDWALPSIDELQLLFGGPANERGFHVTGPVRLTGWQWSSTEGVHPGETWALDFGDGGRASVVNGDSGLNRALCVRRMAP